MATESLSSGVERLDMVELVERCKGGDREAFGELLKQFSPLVSSVIRKYSHAEDDVPDISQEIFLQVFLKIRTVRDAVAFPSWLHTIARNMTINYRKRSPKDATELQDDIVEHEAQTPLDRMITYENRTTVRKAMRRLHGIYKRVITLRYVEGNLLREVAEILTREEGRVVPIGTVKRRLHVARNQLADLLESLPDSHSTTPAAA